ncbi:MAG: hypothetical protein JRF50_04550 [Deltaproteobacteria bacterium]|nr:hypothetical protein [Deltaproteobacteria bacterium]
MRSQGKFREDLFYRLNVVKISLPPLKERKEDIPLLVDHFIHKFNLIKRRSIEGITPEALSFLKDYPFPGNIRELENIIEYAFIPCKGPVIDMEHLPGDVFESFNDTTDADPDAVSSVYDERLPFTSSSPIPKVESRFS